MQNFNPSKLENEKQSRTTQIRHGDALYELIERASISLAVESLRFYARPLRERPSAFLSSSLVMF